MLFNSFDFVSFFILLYPAYLLSRKRQNHLLVVAGWIFYGWWDWRFLFLLYLTAAIDYWAGGAIHRCADPAVRKRWLALSVAGNLTILGFFKYFNFFLDGFERVLNALGFSGHGMRLDIVLPVGISFYTFVSMSYTIDLYRRRSVPARRFVDYAAFVTFFPQLLAGPISRASELLPQIARRKFPSAEQCREGGCLILWGLFKKVFVADNLARIVQPVFLAPEAHSGAQILLGVYAFAFQIYCDFSGYTDIARGLGKLMGVELPLNFNLPYASTHPAEFWRRWHISLSSWFRDYLYIPLGGGRGPGASAYRNVMITMLLAGLWHGANWTFVVWGAYHGALVCLDRWARPLGTAWPRVNLPAARALWRAVRVAVCFHLVCAGWLLFRASSLTQAGLLAKRLVFRFGTHEPAVFQQTLWELAFYLTPLLVLEGCQWKSGNASCVLRAPLPVRAAIYVFLFYAIVIFGVNRAQSFVYFQF